MEIDRTGWSLPRTGSLLIFVAYVYFFQTYPNFISPNEQSRFLLTSAIVDYGTIRIDQPIQAFGDTQDKAVFRGSFYSDKAIGLSLMAVPPYFAWKAASSMLRIQVDLKWILLYLRVVCVTIPFLLFVPLLRRSWQEIGIDNKTGAAVEFIFLFGTIAYPYAAQFVSNSLAGMFLYSSFYFLHRARNDVGAGEKCLLLGGISAGAALLLEYTVALPAGLLVLYAIRVAPSRKALILFSLGIGVFVVILLGYNYAIFGTPFDVTYHHMADDVHSRELSGGIFGFSLPSLSVLYKILLGSERGLFFFCPVLLLAFPGFYYFFRIPGQRWEASLFAAIAGGLTLMISGMGNWNAGWAFGPRYLTPAVPFLMAPVALCWNEWRARSSTIGRWGISLPAALSIMIVAASTITFPLAFPEMNNPFFHLTIPLFLRGNFSENLGQLIGLSPYGSVILFCTILAIAWIARSALPESMHLDRTLLAKCITVPVLSIGILAAAARISVEEPVDTFLRGYACFYLGDYGNALEDLRKAWNSTTDPNLRNNIAYCVGQVQAAMMKQTRSDKKKGIRG